MLLELTPERIVNVWESLKEVLEETLPAGLGQDAEVLERLLRKFLAGEIHVLVSMAASEHEGKPMPSVVAVMVVGPHVDEFSGRSSLMVYVLYGFKAIPDWLYQEDFGQLCDWARGKGYTQISAFSEVTRIVDMWKASGGEASKVFLSYDLGSEDTL